MGRMTAKEVELAYQRLAVLELAQELGNISEACRRFQMSRPMFYEWKRRYEAEGLEGLVNRPPVHKSPHPMTTSPEDEEKILEASLAHPAWGCNRISDHLELAGVSISAPTIQKILNRHDLGNRHDRWLKMEEKVAEQNLVPSAEQVAFIEEQNPCFRQRHLQSSRPGELLIQGSFFLGRKGDRKGVFVRAVIDTYSSYTYGFMDFYEVYETAVPALRRAMRFYGERRLKIDTVLTDESIGAFLKSNKISHWLTTTEEQQNGFVEYFRRAVQDEFFQGAFQRKSSNELEDLRQDFEDWLHYFNTERLHLGYPNMGKTPIKMVDEHGNNK